MPKRKRAEANKKKKASPAATLEDDGYLFKRSLLTTTATRSLLRALRAAANQDGLLCDQFDRVPVKEWRTAPKRGACDALLAVEAIKRPVKRIVDALGDEWAKSSVCSVGLLETPKDAPPGCVHSDLAAAARGAGLTVLVGLTKKGSAGTEVLSTKLVLASEENVAGDYGTGEATEAFKEGSAKTLGYNEGDVLFMGQHTFHRASSTKGRKGVKSLLYLVLSKSAEGLEKALSLDTNHNYGDESS